MQTTLAPPHRSPRRRRHRGGSTSGSPARPERARIASACAPPPGRRRPRSRRPARPVARAPSSPTAETAAVRMAVIGDAFSSARSSPGLAVVEKHARPGGRRGRAWGCPARSHLLQRVRRVRPPRWAGMRPISPPAAGGRATDRSGWCSSSRASEERTPVIASTHSSIVSSPSTSSRGKNEQAHAKSSVRPSARQGRGRVRRRRAPAGAAAGAEARSRPR